MEIVNSIKESEIKILRAQLKVVLEAGVRAIGNHYAPDDCYATGPKTGNAYVDLIECPACAFLSLKSDIDAGRQILEDYTQTAVQVRAEYE